MPEPSPPPAGVAGGSPTGLLRALDGAPVVVLLVDVALGQVIYTNRLAGQLAPGAALPATVEDWARAAGLEGVPGQRTGRGAGPLSELAAGGAVPGAVITARGGSDRSAPREQLWAVGLPLAGPAGMGGRTLVVCLPMGGLDRSDLRTAPDASERMHAQAVQATDVCFTISDARQQDHPLVWVNPAFLSMTGYRAEEVLGRNCRFLQGPDTDPAAVRQIRAALDRQESTTVTVLNHRKDGIAFWNQLSLSPVFEDTGQLAYYVGVQVDVTARVAGEQARSAALEEAERARKIAQEAQAESEQARAEAELARAEAELARASSDMATNRLIQMGEITVALTATLDVDEALTRLTHAVVPAMADWCVVNLLDEHGAPRQVAGRHREAALAGEMARYLRMQPEGLTGKSPVSTVLAGGPPVLLDRLSAEVLDSHVGSAELGRVVRQLGAGSAIVVPLRARRRTHGTLALVNREGGRVFDRGDLALVAEIGRRAGLAIDNARLYAREHDAAMSLQRSLLPTVPGLPGLELHAEYHAGALTAEVGGDWYDVLPLADGSVGLAIGDVMGHDLAAAAAMGQLRSVLRSYAWEGDEPERVMSRLDRLVQGLGMAQLATCCYLRLQHAPGEGGRLTYSNAGHLPPVLIDPDGHARLLEAATSPLIGVPVEVLREQARMDLAPGSTLLLYTDGLVEDRRRDLTDGLSELCRSVSALAGAPLPDLASTLLGPVLARGLDDDLALLAVRLG